NARGLQPQRGDQSAASRIELSPFAHAAGRIEQIDDGLIRSERPMDGRSTEGPRGSGRYRGRGLLHRRRLADGAATVRMRYRQWLDNRDATHRRDLGNRAATVGERHWNDRFLTVGGRIIR